VREPLGRPGPPGLPTLNEVSFRADATCMPVDAILAPVGKHRVYKERRASDRRRSPMTVAPASQFGMLRSTLRPEKAAPSQHTSLRRLHIGGVEEAAGLAAPERGVVAVEAQQRLVGALLGDAAAVEHHQAVHAGDAVRAADRHAGVGLGAAGSSITFFWHFARQAKWLFAALFVIEMLIALTDSAVPWFMGRIVTLVTTVPQDRFLAVTWPMLAGMGLVVLVARPAVALLRYLVVNQAIAAPFTGLIRWQAHWHATSSFSSRRRCDGDFP
jgi:hypothetical protein